MEWPDDVPFRNAALEAQLTYVTVNPVVAWRVHPTLSIAVGPTFNYSDATLRQGVAVSPYYFKFNGDDIAFGFNAGLLWQPHPQWSFGAKYVSATTLDYDGTASFHPAASFLPRPMDTKTHVDFPQMAAGGVSYRPTTNWNIEVDIEWTDWDTTKSVDIDRVGRLVLNWQSSFFYEFGITRELGKGFFASAGYFFSEASTPEKDYTPLVPDTNLHIGSLGFGYKGQRWNWALAGQIIGGSFRTVSGANNPAVDGKYRIFTPTISLAVAYHF
jgi:long-chain fatty acid transport protein